MERENLKSYLTDISHSVASEMAVYSHTLASSMSKPGSSLEADKKQPGVWLEYVYCFVLPSITFKSSTYSLRISVDRTYSNPRMLSAILNKKGDTGQRIQVGSYTLRVKE